MKINEYKCNGLIERSEAAWSRRPAVSPLAVWAGGGSVRSPCFPRRTEEPCAAGGPWLGGKEVAACPARDKETLQLWLHKSSLSKRSIRTGIHVGDQLWRTEGAYLFWLKSAILLKQRRKIGQHAGFLLRLGHPVSLAHASLPSCFSVVSRILYTKCTDILFHLGG